MDLETTQNNVVAKLPLLKQGDYEMWKLWIEQYFQVQDYALWDVIENGNSFKPVSRTIANADGTSTSTITRLVTTEEKAQKKNDVKARSMLLMALPNEHLLTFSQYKDAKTLFEAIQARFDGNDATKKTQKILLNQLAILGENISQEDLNLKFLRSLPSEWNTYVVVWRNKPDLDTMSFDGLYNNFKIVKQEVKRTVTTSSSSISQNMAFVSSPRSPNEVDTANIQVSTVSTPLSTASTHDDTAKLSDVTVYAFLANQPNRARRYFQRTGKKITINGSDTAGYDKSKVECFNCHKMGHFVREFRGPRNQDNRNMNQDSSRRTVNVEETSSKAMVAIDGADSEASKSVYKDTPNEVKKTPDAPLGEKLVSEKEKQTVFPTKIESIKQQEKPARKPVKYAEMYISQKPRGNQRNWNNLKSQQLEGDFVMYTKACFVCGSFDHAQTHCNYHQREGMVNRNNYTRVKYNYSAEKAHPKSHRNMTPRAVIMKTGLKPLNTARPVKLLSPSHKLINTAKEKVYTAKPKAVNTVKPKAVNTARPTSVVVNAVRANHVNAVKASACWVWRPTN
ncbi:ribonuclease H-like domain-containing protein [Tanacetum coccineum]